MNALQKWFDHVKSGSSAMTRAKQHAVATGEGLRQGGEALLVGGILGAIHVEKGLDHNKVPVDAAGGVALLVASVALAHEPMGVDLRNAGSTALGIYGFRKTYELLAEKKRAAGKLPAAPSIAGEFAGESVGVDVGADPVVAAGRFL